MPADGISLDPTIRTHVSDDTNESVLALTAPLFLRKLTDLIDEGLVSSQSRICFVNDGSRDFTWPLIKQLAVLDSHFVGLSLSRNEGHQKALMSGLMEARFHCDMAISLDCDGQDDINATDEMVKAYLDGCDVVYGVRSDRTTDSAFKRFTAESFYRLLSAMGVETVFNHADYRLMSRKALDFLSEFNEVNVFLRGIVPLIGLKSEKVYYERHERLSGKSHYPLRKMLNLALDGITSFSTKPIRFASIIGIVFSIIGLIGVIYALVSFFAGSAVEGWTSTLCIVSLIGGIQLLSIGIIGEYIGKIYLETKHRPRYLVSEYTWKPME